ncbi:MAG: FHIPEP family type III secretion protein, partial [Pseudomonadota bacterium]
PGGQDCAVAGEDVAEPVYGAPARWVSQGDKDELAIQGFTVVTATEVLATHLMEVVKSNFARLLTHKSLRRLLDELTNLSDAVRADANRRMLDELVPDKVPYDLLMNVLRMLLDERVSVRNLPMIIETIAEARPMLGAPEAIHEYVRQKLGFQLIAELKKPDGSVPLVQLAPEWEERFTAHQIDRDKPVADVALPPDQFNRLASNLAEKIAKAAERGEVPAVITSTLRRRFLRTVMLAKGLSNPVISFEELGTDARPTIVGLVPP